jgi:hypothetical protein
MPGTKGCVKRRQTQPAQQQAWQAMRILRRFTMPQLLTTCPALAHRTARHYLARLRRCGYVAKVAGRATGQVGSFDVYGLRRNTGPLAPIARKDSVTMYDPNTQDVWGDGGVLVPLDETVPAKQPRLKPVSKAWLVALLQGRRPQLLLADPDSAGSAATVTNALRKRGLVGDDGALTEAGHALAQKLAQAIAVAAP